ncbi:hypothetical protein GCM10028857_23430 [Salinarchaeum chitinilyticum]
MSDGSDGVGWDDEHGEDAGRGGDADRAVGDDRNGGDRRNEDGDHRAEDGDPSAEEAEYEPSIAGVFGARPDDAPPRRPIVPETPELENVAFVLLGVLLGLFVIYRAAVVFGG